MTKKERNKIIKWAEQLTDEDLEKEYYDLFFESLGTQCEKMYDLGYDLFDILEREKYEKFISEKVSLLEALCLGRGIKLWDWNSMIVIIADV